MTEHTENLVRLGQYVDQRIRDLGMDYVEVAQAANISVETLAKIRRGHSSRPKTIRALEVALKWQPGAARDILAGREPRELPTDTPPPPPTADQIASSMDLTLTPSGQDLQTRLTREGREYDDDARRPHERLVRLDLGKRGVAYRLIDTRDGASTEGDFKADDPVGEVLQELRDDLDTAREILGQMRDPSSRYE